MHQCLYSVSMAVVNFFFSSIYNDINWTWKCNQLYILPPATLPLPILAFGFSFLENSELERRATLLVCHHYLTPIHRHQLFQSSAAVLTVMTGHVSSRPSKLTFLFCWKIQSPSFFFLSEVSRLITFILMTSIIKRSDLISSTDITWTNVRKCARETWKARFVEKSDKVFFETIQRF